MKQQNVDLSQSYNWWYLRIDASLKSTDRGNPWAWQFCLILSSLSLGLKWTFQSLAQPQSITYTRKLSLHGRIVFFMRLPSSSKPYHSDRRTLSPSSNHLQWACPDAGRHVTDTVSRHVLTLRFPMTFAARVKGAKGKVCGTFLSCVTQALSDETCRKKQHKLRKGLKLQTVALLNIFPGLSRSRLSSVSLAATSWPCWQQIIIAAECESCSSLQQRHGKRIDL